jgi:hypothetical protein
VSVSRLPVLGAGDQVRFRGEVRRVTKLAAGAAHLAGLEPAVALTELFTDPDFAVVTAGSRAPLPPEGLLEVLPAEVTEQARWLEGHVAEVVSGLPADAGPDAVPRPEYDPAGTSLRQREISGCGAAMRPRACGGWSITGLPGSPHRQAGLMSEWRMLSAGRSRMRPAARRALWTGCAARWCRSWLPSTG